MLQFTKTMIGDRVSAVDGAVGHIKDFYFDDMNWVIRYVVADTGTWLTGRSVLLSPHAIGRVDADGKTLHLRLRKKQIERCPEPEAHKPVSRQYEIEYFRHYGWPAYWEGSGIWGMGAYPVVIPPTVEPEVRRHYRHREDKHLQSAQAVTGYYIETIDGTLGHVSGFLIDDNDWTIRQLVVETGHWYAGREVLISPSDVSRISYPESTVFVTLAKADIERTEKNEEVHAVGTYHG